MIEAARRQHCNHVEHVCWRRKELMNKHSKITNMYLKQRRAKHIYRKLVDCTICLLALQGNSHHSCYPHSYHIIALEARVSMPCSSLPSPVVFHCDDSDQHCLCAP